MNTQESYFIYKYIFFFWCENTAKWYTVKKKKNQKRSGRDSKQEKLEQSPVKERANITCLSL